MSKYDFYEMSGFHRSKSVGRRLEAIEQREMEAKVLMKRYTEIDCSVVEKILNNDAVLCPASNKHSLFKEFCREIETLTLEQWQENMANHMAMRVAEKGELLLEIKKWQSAGTPSASDILLKENTLNKLHEQLRQLEKSPLTTASSNKEKNTHSPAQIRQIELIEKVRELMMHELNTIWPDGKRGLKMHVINQHYPQLQRLYGRNVSKETMAGKTKPSECKKLGIPELP